MFFRDRQRIIRKNENIRAQRLEEAAEMAEENDIDAVQNQTGHANGTAGASSTLVAGATSTTSLATPAQEERRPSAAFKPPPPPPEKQWEQKGVHYRSEGGVMHIHKSDSSKLSTGPGDEAEKEPLMSAPDGGASSEDKAEEFEFPAPEPETEPELEQTAPESPTEDPVDDPSEDATAETTTMATTSEATTESSETKVQVHVTVSVSEHDDKVITSTSTEGLKQLESSTVTETSASGTTTQVHKLFTTSDGSRTQTGTELPDVSNGDPAAWV